MCTRDEGERIRSTYDKYKTEKKVEEKDLKYLDILASSSRIQYIYRNDGLYAKVARL